MEEMDNMLLSVACCLRIDNPRDMLMYRQISSVLEPNVR